MRILCNCAMSADGKIGTPDRSHASFGSDEDKRRMSLLRRQADAVLVGGATFRAGAQAIPDAQAMIEDPSHFPDPPARTSPVWNIILTKTMRLPEESSVYTDPRVRPLVITEGISAPRHALGDRVEVIALPEVNGKTVIAELEKRGIQALLLESGGDLTSMFFHAGLVDELYLTIAPLVLGGHDSPSPVGGAAFSLASGPRLSLLETTVKENEVFLHYRVERGAR